jgi:hypothetical protein
VLSISGPPPWAISLRRGEIIAFWTLGAIVLTAAVWVVAALLGAAMPWVWATASGGGIVLPGVFWRPWFQFGVRGWNRIVWEVSGALRTYVLMVCYYLLFGAVSRAGLLDLGRPGGKRSGWIVRSGEPRAFGDPVSSNASWYRALSASARGWNTWVILLMPVLLLLFLLRVEHVESGPPSGTYTLY